MNALSARCSFARGQKACLRLLFALALGAGSATAAIRVTDVSGMSVALARPAERIVSLAPNITELLFAAGAGARVVGTVEFSNFPHAARQITRIGDSAQLDLERIVALRPDLIIAWQSGSAQRQLVQLLHLGIPVFLSDAHRLPDIAREMERFGRLAGSENVARQAAQAFLEREAELRRRYAARSPVTVFYQIWDKPLMTVNGDHLISDVIRLCGGRNVFADLRSLVAEISTEAVLAANPEAIGGMTTEAGQQGNLAGWKSWPRLTAVARGNLFAIHADLISRDGPRILDAAEQMCAQLDAARSRRK